MSYKKDKNKVPIIKNYYIINEFGLNQIKTDKRIR